MTSLFRRAIRCCSLVVVLALIAAACGSDSPSTLALGETVASNESRETVLRLATADPRPLLSGIAEWERAHPTARVEIEVRQPEDLERSILAGVDGVPIDLVTLDPTSRNSARENPQRFVDLQEFASPAELLSFPDDYLDAALGAEAQLLGLPIYTDSLALVVRTDILDGGDVRALSDAHSWCEVLTIANDFSLATQNAFFANASDVARGLLAQTGDSLVDSDVNASVTGDASLEEIWDTATAALGIDPIHGGTCDNHSDFGAMSRNLRFADEVWVEAALAGFAATVVAYGELDELAAAIPDTAGDWEVLPLPGDVGTTGELAHLGILSTSEHVALAFDLVATLASPESQRHSFSEGSPGLPTATELTQSDLVASAQNDFFNSDALAPFADGLANRPITQDTLERAVIVEETLEAIVRVGGGEQNSTEAWAILLANIESRVP